MKNLLVTLCLLSSLLVAHNASCDEWTLQSNALRFNIGIVVGETNQLLSVGKPGVVSSLPQIGSSILVKEQQDELGLMVLSEPKSLTWFASDSDNPITGFASFAPSCSPSDKAEPVTRASAWDSAYECLISLTSSKTLGGTPLLEEFLGDSGNQSVYGIEPVLDLLNSEFASKSQKAQESSSENDKEMTYTAPSPVWPSGPQGWHREDGYSQLASAYKEVFPEEAKTQSKVLVAHLDTGYFFQDPNRPKYLNADLSKTCYRGGCIKGAEASWDSKELMSSPGHGTGTISNLAGGPYSKEKESQDTVLMGGNPSATVFSIKIHDSVVHLDSRRMAKGIEQAVADKADLITLSHGGLPSLRLASAVNTAYESGTPIFAATGDFFELPFFMGRTFRSVVYPARYNRVMGVAGVTKNEENYGENPSLLWWFSFGPGYFQRLGSWMLRGNFGPTSVMENGNILSAYSPNITRSQSKQGPSKKGSEKTVGIASNGAGTSHATPQVAAAASLWLEKNKESLDKTSKWRSWEKSEAVYQALRESSSRCFADYNVKHYGRGILKAKDALSWEYASSPDGKAQLTGPKSRKIKLDRRKEDNLDLPGIVELFMSARLPNQYQNTIKEALANSLATELSQLVFTSNKIQEFLQKFHICKPTDGCDRCVRQDILPEDWISIVNIVNDLPDASKTLKEAIKDLPEVVSKRK